ncbi:MAG: CPBP family intramembrane metalloprotease [Cytophagales bacterium]|nr:CPBP family intramembrane metalloprotease [Cytophagales bacterium]MDW8384465.1 CPBP family intramembrane glutamate endopeptidase [Flammeovirgaceae bacterium]
MSRIFAILIKYFSLHFPNRFGISWIVILVIALYVNYGAKLWNSDKHLSFLEAIFLYGLAFWATTGLWLYFQLPKRIFKFKELFKFSCWGVLLPLASNAGFEVQFWIIPPQKVPLPLWDFFYQISYNLQSIVFYSCIPLIYAYLYEKHQFRSIYGLKDSDNLKVYVGILIAMIPLIIWASVQQDFLEIYPRYRYGSAEEYLNISPWITTALYELTYVLHFIALEVFFRGFLVRTLAIWLHDYAVFPMTACYMVLHFEKPLAECIGSILGGYILGILSFETRSIQGGIVLHVGIAIMMEIAAFLQIKN